MTRYSETHLTRAVTGTDLPIIVSLARHDMALAESAAEAGADAIKLHLNAYHRASGTTFGTFAQERPFFEEVATLGLPLLVMAGQETMPTADDMEALADLGVEGFNVYLDQMQPQLLASRLRPMPAISDTSSVDDILNAARSPGAWVEASFTCFEDYGSPVTESDIERYRRIAKQIDVPIIAPSQKRFTSEDVSALHGAGVNALLLGVIVTGDTPSTMRARVADIVAAARMF